jgi:hypothetical protein
MQFRYIFMTAAAAMLAQHAQAANPPDALALGALQGMLGFCSQIDAKDDKRFDQHAERLTAGLSDRQIREIKASADYKQAYQLLTTVLKELPPAEALPGCVEVAKQTVGNMRPTIPAEGSRK